MSKANAVIGQSGGPTSVINSSLCGVIQAARDSKAIGRLYGMRFGILGFLESKMIDLGKVDPGVIEGLRATPASALGSCRKKLHDDELPSVLELFRKHDIRYLFMIGGNDTMDTINRIVAFCREKGYELFAVGIPKTVDNDLCGTDHTPGYGSAGRYVALSVLQGGLLARDMRQVDSFVIYQAVGRDAGWLAAASAVARNRPEDPPHLIYVPERSFDPEQFIEDVSRCQRSFGYVSIVCGEGIHYADGTPVSASSIKDKFGNIEFGAMGGTSAAMFLHRILSSKMKLRGEFQVVESLQMCAMDRVSAVDLEEAYRCGRKAVELVQDGISGVMVSIVREEGGNIGGYASSLGTAPLGDVAVRSKPMPDHFISEQGNYVTEDFIRYVAPLIGELPRYVSLEPEIR